MKEEPVLNQTAVKVLMSIVLSIAARYLPGLNLTPDQALFMSMGIFSLFSAGFAFFTRSKVTSMAKVARVMSIVADPATHDRLMMALNTKKAA